MVCCSFLQLLQERKQVKIIYTSFYLKEVKLHPLQNQVTFHFHSFVYSLLPMSAPSCPSTANPTSHCDYIHVNSKYRSVMLSHIKSLGHRWQTQGPRPESGPPPCFIQPGTLFLPCISAELLAPS